VACDRSSRAVVDETLDKSTPVRRMTCPSKGVFARVANNIFHSVEAVGAQAREMAGEEGHPGTGE